MPVIDSIAAFREQMTEWRRHLHAHPEIAFEEHETAAFVAARLEEWGIEVRRGMAGTGVVGTLVAGDGPAIGLRADMDALAIHEANAFPHRSVHAGCMHACGHDGHMAMLLGAARYLSETRQFKGTVHFIFQPAEENEGGGRVMVEQGLFKQFPMMAIYGMHNWPGLASGRFALRAGPVMAAFDIFEVTVVGKGTHAAMPHLGVDPVVTASAIVTGLQSIASRVTDPLEALVISVTQFHAGDTWNVIPERAVLRGTVRALSPEVQDKAESALCRMVESIAAAHGAGARVHYERRYPPTINDAAETENAAIAAALVVGEDNVERDRRPSMGSEDFAFMLEKKAGSYVWIGNGAGAGAGHGHGGCALHNPRYDFNDEILPLGASYWAKLVETRLG